MLSASRLQTIICTSNIDDARNFYADILGLRMRRGTEGALVFDVGGSDLRVCAVPSTTPSEHTAVGFAVDDLDSAIAFLSDKGVDFERFPDFAHEPNGALTTPDGARVVWLRDPDGNILSIVQFPVDAHGNEQPDPGHRTRTAKVG